MSLSAKLKGAVDSAFNAAGDLVKTGQLSTKTVTGYNFTNGTVTSTSSSNSVGVIITTKENPADGGLSLQAILKSGVVLDSYDTIKIDNVTYNITDTTDDGFTINLTIVKED